jgi:hypothetical protein
MNIWDWTWVVLILVVGWVLVVAFKKAKNERSP